jgi:hypothetical protein
MKAKVRMEVEFNIDDLIEELAFADHKTVLALVTRLDARMADWSFTMQLAEHFRRLGEEYEREVVGLDR